MNYKKFNQQFIIKLNLMISKFIEICQNFNGIRLLVNNITFFIKFEINGLIHMLGFNRLYYFKNIKASQSLQLIQRKKIRIEMVIDNKTSKNDLKIIFHKILSFFQFINFLETLDSNFIKLYFENGEFKNYKYSGIFQIYDNTSLILTEHKNINKPNFHSFSIISIRNNEIDRSWKKHNNENFNYIQKINLVPKK